MRNKQLSLIKIKKDLNAKKKGFTLVELMVVLAIIATITFIAVPNFTSIKASVNEKVDKQSCEAIKRIITTFVIDDTIDASKITELTYDATNKKVDNQALSAEVENALSDVKAPRTDSSKVYKITINKNEKDGIVYGTNVSVMVDGENSTKTE